VEAYNAANLVEDNSSSRKDNNSLEDNSSSRKDNNNVEGVRAAQASKGVEAANLVADNSRCRKWVADNNW
jgi:hypothetical protein